GLSRADIKGVIPISGVYTIPPDPVFDLAFGKDLGVRTKASPLCQVCSGLPPFLICYAEKELPGCDGRAAEEFRRALKDKGCLVQTLEAKGRNHLSIMVNATSETDVLFQAMLGFVSTQVALERLCCGGCDGVTYLQQCIARYALVNSRP